MEPNKATAQVEHEVAGNWVFLSRTMTIREHLQFRGFSLGLHNSLKKEDISKKGTCLPWNKRLD